MDYFEAQETARKRTGLLVVLFVAAVVGIIAVIYGVVHVAIGPGAGPIDPFLLGQVAVGVALVVAIGSATRTASLRRGGPAVAELLGGRRVAPDTTDADERRLINVVEEMALASGTPVPAIYVVDGEDSLNAFAAGFSPNDAAVAVTRGSLRGFTRDELQGVIAHEFSHILNGDMRLNIRLIGTLYGILLLTVIGRGILHFGPRGRGGGGRDNGAGAVMLIALALLLVGYIGVFFGKLIKAAVSRQREYLADSAAVEFTRNPDGLASALKKIATAPAGSRIENHHAEELSHLFFANGLRSSLFGMLSTHPPIDERIRRLDPTWEARGERHSIEPGADGIPGASGLTTAKRRDAVPAAAPLGRRPANSPASVISSIGTPTRAHLDYADALLAGLPEPVRRAAHRSDGAAALVFALIGAAGDSSGAFRVVSIAGEFASPTLAKEVAQLIPLVRPYGSARRLELLDLLLPALGTLSPAEAEAFLGAVDHAIAADGEFKLFEIALRHILAHRLGGPDAGDRGTRSIDSFRPLAVEAAAILSALAWVGSGRRRGSAEDAFAAGAALLPREAGHPVLADRSTISARSLDQALSAFHPATPRVRRRLLEACAACAAHDNEIDPVEMEVLIAVSAAMDCPMPPLLDAEGF